AVRQIVEYRLAFFWGELRPVADHAVDGRSPFVGGLLRLIDAVARVADSAALADQCVPVVRRAHVFTLGRHLFLGRGFFFRRHLFFGHHLALGAAEVDRADDDIPTDANRAISPFDRAELVHTCFTGVV